MTKKISRETSAERVNAAAAKMNELKNKYSKPVNTSIAQPKKEKVITKVDNPIVTSAAAKMAEIANRTKK